MCDEQPEIRMAVRQDVEEGARLMVQLEHDFIDMCFAEGEVEGLNPHDIKMLINSRANTKLGDLGYDPIFETDESSLERMAWFDMLGAGVEHQDFFAQRPTAYAKGAVDWSSAW
jgi:ribonucleoside-diphosphate reductase beta chain